MEHIIILVLIIIIIVKQLNLIHITRLVGISVAVNIMWQKPAALFPADSLKLAQLGGKTAELATLVCAPCALTSVH